MRESLLPGSIGRRPKFMDFRVGSEAKDLSGPSVGTILSTHLSTAKAEEPSSAASSSPGPGRAAADWTSPEN